MLYYFEDSVRSVFNPCAICRSADHMIANPTCVLVFITYPLLLVRVKFAAPLPCLDQITTTFIVGMSGSVTAYSNLLYLTLLS